MQAVTIPQITDNLQKLPADKLSAVYDFVRYLAEKATEKFAATDVIQLTTSEYEQLLSYKRMAIFNEFTLQFGKEVEKRGLTEEELMADLEETKREVFEEQYGRR